MWESAARYLTGKSKDIKRIQDFYEVVRLSESAFENIDSVDRAIWASTRVTDLASAAEAAFEILFFIEDKCAAEEIKEHTESVMNFCKVAKSFRGLADIIFVLG